MLRSLRMRFALGALVAISLALFIVWMSIGKLFIDYVTQSYEREMGAIVDTVAARLTVVDGQLQIAREPGDPRFALPGGGRYWQVSPKKGAILRSRSLWDVAIDPKNLLPDDLFGIGAVEGPDGQPIFLFSRDMTILVGQTPVAFTVYAGFPEREFLSVLDGYGRRVSAMFLMTSILLAGAAFLQASVGLRPLVRLSEKVTLIRLGQLRRMDEAVPSELTPLISEINMLLEEREKAVERARGRASDLAHGLKTPLTVLAHLADELPIARREVALEQIELIRQRADRQLQAARLGVEQMVTTDVESLAGKLVKVLQPLARDRNISWTIDIQPGLVAATDPGDLAEALGNILDNAVKWARSQIVLTARRLEDRVVIAVADDGLGVNEEDHDEVLRRGGRLGAGAAGTGLGLAISIDILEAYGGALQLAGSSMGGLLVTLEFPATSVRHTPRHPV